MDTKARKKALRLLSNGVYVLTSRSAEHFGAATVTWVTQVSFKPPLIMAALRRDSNVFRCLTESGVAALHIVGDGQKELARRFFFPTRTGRGTINDEAFAAGTTSAPILASLPAHVECKVERVVDTEGDHAVVIFEVVEAECPERVQPLTMAQTQWVYGG